MKCCIRSRCDNYKAVALLTSEGERGGERERERERERWGWGRAGVEKLEFKIFMLG